MKERISDKFSGNTSNKLMFRFLFFISFSLIANANNYSENKNTAIALFEPNQSSDYLTVRGIVTDENGKALGGVMVLLKERARKVQTDINGQYVITLSRKEHLEFSCFGFKSKTVKVSAELLNIKLKKI